MIFKKKISDPRFLKVLKISTITLVSIFGLIYLAFLFILPNVLDVNKFTPLICSEIKKATALECEINNPEFKTTWRFGVKIGAENINLTLPDKSDFVALNSVSVEVNLPTLILRHLNLDKIYAKDVKISMVFDKNKNYTIIEHFKNNVKQPQEQTQAEALPIKIKNINIIADSFNFALDDKNLNKTYVIAAKPVLISMPSLSGPLKIKTNGYIGTLGKDVNFVDFNVALQTKLPDFSDVNKEQDENKQAFDFNFNPFEGLDLFSFHSRVNMDLKITDLGEKFKAKGYLNIDNISLMVDDYQLPDGYLKFNFDKSKIISDSKIFLSKDENLVSKGTMDFSGKNKIDLSAKTEKISLTNIKSLCASVLDMLKIKNDVESAKAKGYIVCNFNIKSDLKIIKSSGYLKLVEGSISYPKLALLLDKISANLNFDDNKISIKDTFAYLNGSRFAVLGDIYDDSSLSVNIKSDPLKISDIVNLLVQLKALKSSDIKDFAFNGGNLTISIDAKGKLQNILPKADIQLNNLSILQKSTKMPLSIEKISIVATPDKKDFLANVDVVNFKVSQKNPAFLVSSDKASLKLNSKDIEIIPFKVNLQGSSVNVSGQIKDYMKSPELDIAINGNILPSSILTFVPAQNRKYVAYSGSMPLGITLKNTLDDLSILGTLTTDAKNYISIVDIKNIRAKKNVLSADLNLKGGNLNIKALDILSSGSKVASINGKIGKIYSTSPVLNPLNIVTSQKLSVLLPAFDQLSFDVSSNLALSGSVNSPSILGEVDLSSLSYPKFKTTLSDADLQFKKGAISAQAKYLKIGNSDFSGTMNMSSNFAKIITINSLDFNSNYIDSDELLKLFSSMPNTQTTSGPSLPLTVKSGKGKVAKFKSGNLLPENITFNFNLNNNLLNVSDLIASFADGKVEAKASYNIANTKTTVDATLKSLNAPKALRAFVGSSSVILSGTLNAIAQVNFRGATYEQQMRNLNGQVKFDISNGQYGEAARFERFLHAGNLLSQSLFNLNINSAISSVTSRNTGEFKKIDGSITLQNGWANINSFKSSGPNMSLYVTGRYNILTTNSDLKVLGRISSRIVSVLGPVGSFSIDKLISKLPQSGQNIFNAIKSVTPQNPLFEQVSASELKNIPSLSQSTDNSTAKDFQVVVLGPVNKATSIKQFKWISTDVPTAASTTSATSSQ